MLKRGYGIRERVKRPELILAVFFLGACTPTLNWREAMAPGTGVVTSFPCRPDRHAREVEVAGHGVQMEMLVCAAGEATYALAFFDVDDPAEIAQALVSLRRTLIGNIRTGGSAPVSTHPVALKVKGMTPSPEAGRWSIEGRRPDGTAMRAEGAFFAHGLRIYQAAVVGSLLAEDAVEPFFAGLKFPG